MGPPTDRAGLGRAPRSSWGQPIPRPEGPCHRPHRQVARGGSPPAQGGQARCGNRRAGCFRGAGRDLPSCPPPQNQDKPGIENGGQQYFDFVFGLGLWKIQPIYADAGRGFWYCTNRHDSKFNFLCVGGVLCRISKTAFDFAYYNIRDCSTGNRISVRRCKLAS